MATLASNASATQERLKVSAIPAGDYFQIDDEIVRVIDKRTTQLTILVERAYAGTTAATHNSGATLTPLYVPSTGGGSQAVRLVGPVRITGAPEEFTLIEDLPSDAIVLSAWAVRVSLYDQPVTVMVSLVQSLEVTGLQRNAVVYSNAGTAAGTDPNGADLSYQFDTVISRQVAHATSGVHVLAGYVGPDDVAPSTGSVDCYALIAEAS